MPCSFAPRPPDPLQPIFTSIWWPLFSSPSLESGMGGAELEPRPAAELDLEREEERDRDRDREREEDLEDLEDRELERDEERPRLLDRLCDLEGPLFLFSWPLRRRARILARKNS